MWRGLRHDGACLQADEVEDGLQRYVQKSSYLIRSKGLNIVPSTGATALEETIRFEDIDGYAILGIGQCQRSILMAGNRSPWPMRYAVSACRAL